MDVIKNPIAAQDLQAMAEHSFGDLVKAVVDVEQGIMAVGGDLHSDEEDSMINIRPSQGNRSRGVEDAAIRDRIEQIVDSLIQR